MRHTRENAPIIKGFNDSVGRYWGFVLSLITRFNKRISSPRSPASWAACPSVCVTFIRRRFMKPPITDAQTNHNCWPGCPELGGRQCAFGMPVVVSASPGWERAPLFSYLSRTKPLNEGEARNRGHILEESRGMSRS